MNRVAVIIFYFGISLAVYGQALPEWLNEDFRRMKYPESSYYTGFAYGEISQGKSLQDITQRVKTDAQTDLSNKIRMQITARIQREMSASSSNGRYDEMESFINHSSTESSAEVTDVKTESYYDAKARIVYAFAYVNRYELIGFHKSNITTNLVQVEGLLQTARNLEATREKSKARHQCEAAIPLLAKVRLSQEMLVTLDGNISSNELQQSKTEDLHNQLTQMEAQLAQAVIVYVECVESNFGQTSTVVCNQMKSSLSGKGCSFTDDPENADFRIQIGATTRYHGEFHNLITCFADVTVKLFDVQKAKSVFQDEFSKKGVATSKETAGKKALENGTLLIVEKISIWIN